MNTESFCEFQVDEEPMTQEECKDYGGEWATEEREDENGTMYIESFCEFHEDEEPMTQEECEADGGEWVIYEDTDMNMEYCDYNTTPMTKEECEYFGGEWVIYEDTDMNMEYCDYNTTPMTQEECEAAGGEWHADEVDEETGEMYDTHCHMDDMDGMDDMDDMDMNDMLDEDEDPEFEDYTDGLSSDSITFTGFEVTSEGITFKGTVTLEGLVNLGTIEVYTANDFTISGFHLMDTEEANNWVKFKLITSGDEASIDETIQHYALPFYLFDVTEYDEDESEGGWSFERGLEDCDQDGDSLLTYEELETCVKTDLVNDGFSEMTTEELHLEESFTMSDMDSDGYLDQSEFDYLSNMMVSDDTLGPESQEDCEANGGEWVISSDPDMYISYCDYLEPESKEDCEANGGEWVIYEDTDMYMEYCDYNTTPMTQEECEAAGGEWHADEVDEETGEMYDTHCHMDDSDSDSDSHTSDCLDEGSSIETSLMLMNWPGDSFEAAIYSFIAEYALNYGGAVGCYQHQAGDELSPYYHWDVALDLEHAWINDTSNPSDESLSAVEFAQIWVENNYENIENGSMFNVSSQFMVADGGLGYVQMTQEICEQMDGTWINDNNSTENSDNNSTDNSDNVTTMEPYCYFGYEEENSVLPTSEQAMAASDTDGDNNVSWTEFKAEWNANWTAFGNISEDMDLRDTLYEGFNNSDSDDNSMLDIYELETFLYGINELIEELLDSPEWAFTQMDANDDGEVNAIELANSSDELEMEDAEMVVAMYDVDNSDGLNMSEFELMMFDIEYDIEPTLEMTFRALDSNSDGELDSMELMTMMSINEPDVEESESESKFLLRMFDDDNSGGLNIDEFDRLKMMSDNQDDPSEERMFKGIDLNSDGEVTATELAQAPGEDVVLEDMQVMIDMFDADESGALSFSEFVAMLNTDMNDMQPDLQMLVVMSMEQFHGSLSDYSFTLANCDREVVCSEDVYSVLLGDVIVTEDSMLTGQLYPVSFMDTDASGTISTGDVIIVDHNQLDDLNLSDWNTPRLHSEEAGGYSDENPMMPGFTGLLATIGLLGAALIRRE